ncbi:MAG: hypothetical protein QXO04_01450 [Nitrososphaerota archaeon]
MTSMRRWSPTSHIILIIVLLWISVFEPISALSRPIYPPQRIPIDYPGLIAGYEGWLVVQDAAQRAIYLVSPETWEARLLVSGVDAGDMLVLGDLLAIAPREGPLIIYDIKARGERRLETPGRIEDLEAGDGVIWASIPSLGLIVGINSSSFEVARTLSISACAGREKISASDNALWVINQDCRSITRIDLRSGSKSALELDEQAIVVKAISDEALIATSGNKILKISSNLRIQKTWSLGGDFMAEAQLYQLADGRIIYVAPSRWIIGEIEGDRITEFKTMASIGGSALAGDRIWFTEPSKGRIGYAPLSRSPKITAFKVEKAGGEVFRAYLEASDPDGEPLKAYLIAYYPDLIGARQNRTYEMNQEDGRYALEFTVDQGMRAEVYAAVVDPYNNLARSEKVMIEAERVETETSWQTTRTSQTHAVTPADIYALASSLLLFIPIIIAIIYLKGRRKRRR